MNEDEVEQAYEQLMPSLRSCEQEGLIVLENILGSLDDSQLIRARIDKPRVKGLSSVKRKIQEQQITISDMGDLVGFRVICNNVEDVYRINDGIVASGRFEISGQQDYIQQPQSSGYRALHLDARFKPSAARGETQVPCEIQIRTLAQDVWANLTHYDIYKDEANPSEFMGSISTSLAELLATVDRIAGDLRAEVRKPVSSQEPDTLTEPPRSESLAFIYERRIGSTAEDYAIQSALEYCRRFGVDRLDELDAISSDSEFKDSLRAAYREVTSWELSDDLLFDLCIVGAGRGRDEALAAAKSWGAAEKEEIAAFAQREALRELPDSYGELVDTVSDVDRQQIPTFHPSPDLLEAFDALRECAICGTAMVDGEAFVSGALEHYELDDDASGELMNALYNSDLEINDYDNPSLCAYHAYQMSRD